MSQSTYTFIMSQPTYIFVYSHNVTLRLHNTNGNNFFSSKPRVCVDSILRIQSKIFQRIQREISDFKDLETDFPILSNPFSVNVNEVPQKISNGASRVTAQQYSQS